MQLRRKIAVAIAAGVGTVGIATPALATIAYPEGGIWDYGTGGGIVWSDYYHGSRCHGSSVQGQYYYRSPNTAAGRWSIADAPDRVFAVDHSYYRFC